MEAWIFISVAAAAFQTLRFMLQKSLSTGTHSTGTHSTGTLSTGTLSPGGATLARFFYSAPFVLCLALGYALWRGEVPTGFSRPFWGYALGGGLAQILATWCVVALLSQRNFAVGITFKKTEVIQTALIGMVILGDRVSLAGMAAIMTGLIGVLVLSDAPEGAGRGPKRFMNKAAGLGLISGLFFALSAVGYRGATLEIASADALMRAVVTLAVVTTAQAAGMSLWLRWRETGELARVWAARRTAVWMGLTGLGGSLCWFTAFTLQNAAYVFAVGQVEVIFSLMASVLFFHETIKAREMLGIGLLTASILLLVVLA